MSYGVGDTGYMGQVNNTAFLERQLRRTAPAAQTTHPWISRICCCCW